jgi:hypothetical protein
VYSTRPFLLFFLLKQNGPTNLGLSGARGQTASALWCPEQRQGPARPAPGRGCSRPPPDGLRPEATGGQVLFFFFYLRLDRIGTSTGQRSNDRFRQRRQPVLVAFLFFLLRIADLICTSLHDLCCSVKNSSVQTKKKNDDQRYAKQDLNLKLSCRKDRGPWTPTN